MAFAEERRHARQLGRSRPYPPFFYFPINLLTAAATIFDIRNFPFLCSPQSNLVFCFLFFVF